MKRQYLLLIPAFALSSALFIAGCKKEATPEAPKPPNQDNQPIMVDHGERGPIFTVRRTQHIDDSLLRLPEARKKLSSLDALTEQLKRPQPPIPPHYFPAHGIKLISTNDSEAVYTLLGLQSLMRGEVKMIRIGRGADTVWTVARVEELGPPNPQ